MQTASGQGILQVQGKTKTETGNGKQEKTMNLQTATTHRETVQALHCLCTVVIKKFSAVPPTYFLVLIDSHGYLLEALDTEEDVANHVRCMLPRIASM
jgi:hypothetical protein